MRKGRRRKLPWVMAIWLLGLMGNVVGNTEAAAAASYQYDEQGRLTDYRLTEGPGMSYIYDSNGNLRTSFASLAFDGTRQLPLTDISVNTVPNGKNTVEFWMYWDGTEGTMPFAWDGYYDLWFAEGYFGFNTGDGDMIGVSSTNMQNRWVHVAAVFYNGVPNAMDNELYIDGVKQVIAPVLGTTWGTRSAAPAAFVSGWGVNPFYRFDGSVADLRVYDRALTALEVASRYEDRQNVPEGGFAGSWRLGQLPNAATALHFDRTNQVRLDQVAANTAPGGKNTVEFWMYWDGTVGVMPFSWNNYHLWFHEGYFGFNTGESNVIGLSSSEMLNCWVHVAAVFYNGLPNPADNELYINGEKRTLAPVVGTTTISRSAGEEAYFSGTTNGHYLFTGYLSELRIWDRALSEAEVRSRMYYHATGSEANLAGVWRSKPSPYAESFTAFHGTEQTVLNASAVDTTIGMKNTVEFWMYWDGTEGGMPFSWGSMYDLWFYEGYFGFNTGQSDILGISSKGLKNRWVHVAAIFYNGVPNAVDNEPYIDGVKQALGQVLNTTTLMKVATPEVYISGTANTTSYRILGRVGEVRIWNYGLSAQQVETHYHRLTFRGDEGGLAAYWRGVELNGIGW